MNHTAGQNQRVTHSEGWYYWQPRQRNRPFEFASFKRNKNLFQQTYALGPVDLSFCIPWHQGKCCQQNDEEQSASRERIAHWMEIPKMP